uniref:hypothetical protein n=1 Tax=Streptomyces chartreusis TaxID=1969 RepID=UPI003F493335
MPDLGRFEVRRVALGSQECVEDKGDDVAVLEAMIRMEPGEYPCRRTRKASKHADRSRILLNHGRATSTNTAIAVENYAGARRELLAAILADQRNGISANDIARMTEPAWSRQITLDYLNCWELFEGARNALTAAGL